MSLRSNPRMILIFLVVIIMFAVSVLGFIFLTAITGIILLAIAVFLSVQFLRFALSHIRSHVRTDDEGITFHMPTNEEERFEWTELSHTGFCTPSKGRPFAFVYGEERDRLITIPMEYEHFERLVDELEAQTRFTRFDLPVGMTIQAKLREVLGLPDPDERPADDELETSNPDETDEIDAAEPPDER